MEQAGTSPSGRPSVTIITVNRNNLVGLRATLDSVAGQDFKDFEHIVVDGASDDGSAELLREYPHLSPSSVSESDKGIYNAMNKGIALAKGDYLLFLNSGDRLVGSGTLGNIAPFFGEHDLVYGRDTLVRADGVHWLKPYPAKLRFSFMHADTLPHCSTFIRKGLFEKVGLYDESMKISADWKFFMLALYIHHATCRHADVPVAVFALDGISADPAQFPLIREERRSVMQAYFPHLMEDFDELQELRDESRRFADLRQRIRASRLIGLLRSFGLLGFLEEKTS